MRVLISLPQSVCTMFIEYTEKRVNGRLKSTNLNGIKATWNAPNMINTFRMIQNIILGT